MGIGLSPIQICNEGRTAAWIDEKLACFQIVKDLPKQPNLGDLEPLDLEPEWVAAKSGEYKDHTLEAQGQQDMDMLVIWGIIRYRDNLSGKHETTFGFWIAPDTSLHRVTGLTEYNKNT